MLRFTVDAWAKLHWFCHAGNTEIGGFAVTAEKDPLLIERFVTVKQQTTSVNVEFDDDAVADLFDEHVDSGLTPSRFARIWLHTHPGNCPQPSGTDEATFARVFGRCDWAVMFILAEGGETYARLRFNTGPGGQIQIPVAVDYAHPYIGSDHEDWKQEYDRNVHPLPQMSYAWNESLRSTDASLASEFCDEHDAWLGLDASEQLDVLAMIEAGEDPGDYYPELFEHDEVSL